MMRCVCLLCVSVFAVACSSAAPQSYASLELSQQRAQVVAAPAPAKPPPTLVVSSPKANESLPTYIVMHGKATPGRAVWILVTHKHSTHIGQEIRVNVDKSGNWKAEVDVSLTDSPSKEEEDNNAYEYQIHVRDEASELDAVVIPVKFWEQTGC